MAKYLVTGGLGFIGSNIARELINRGEDVVVLDNLSTGDISNLDGIENQVQVIEGDIRNESDLGNAMRGVDYVLHQAALRAVERSIDNPADTNDVNISGTVKVLVAARDNSVKRVVMASSSSVYGSIDAERNVETLPLIPESPYALTKMTGEHYSRLFFELYGLETASLRYFNVFGPYQSPESKYSAVIPILVSHLMKEEAPEIHWDGNQSRDFTYVSNIVEANILAATSPGLKPGDAYNIGNGENTSINELYAKLQDLLGVYIKPIYKPKRAGDVPKTYADIEKARQDLGYEPKVGFAEGLKRSIEWYKARV